MDSGCESNRSEQEETQKNERLREMTCDKRKKKIKDGQGREKFNDKWKRQVKRKNRKERKLEIE